MFIDLSQFTKSLSTALDYAERELFDVSQLHGLRVAVLTNRMAEYFGVPADERFALTQAALLHDCALSEYFNDEIKTDGSTAKEADMKAHCIAGENMLKKLPFYYAVNGAVLYHHECADGSGAFRLKASETPLYAQMIHLADNADIMFSLDSCDKEKYDSLISWIKENTGSLFGGICAEAFLGSIDYSFLESISGEGVNKVYDTVLSCGTFDVSIEALREMSLIFAEITDYKSHFTCRHSKGIAEKAEAMGRYYSLPDEECEKLYIAGALHDVGKLLVSNSILEKPDRLSAEEYRDIQNHAVGTWNLLKDISGMEDICRWAALHHEKLDGSGYPFGYRGEALDRNSRLMACLDVYQALVEDRPYKAGISHKEAMAILRNMGDRGQLDTVIIDDIDSCFFKDRGAKIA